MTSRPSSVFALAGLGLLILGGLAHSQEDRERGRQDEEILGGSAAFNLERNDNETVWIDEGMPLFELPDAASSRLAVVDFRSELEVLERDGEWRKVRYGSRLGWVQPDLPWKDRVVEVHRDLDALSVSIPMMNAESLGHEVLARELLGATGSARSLGPYALLTDVHDDAILGAMSDIAGHLDVYYRERYAVELMDTGPQTVALFASEETYRKFEEETTDRPREDRHGHAIGNLASLFVGDKQIDEVLPLLVHELTHLINRRALGQRPPAWIEEGIANDLSYSRVDRTGRLRRGTLGGSNTVFGSRYEFQVAYSGGLSSLMNILRSRSRRQGTPLDQLVAMSHDDFMAPDKRQLHYIESAFLIRLLLDGPRSGWGDGLRLYLDEVANHRHPTAAELAALLGASWPRIERALDAWLNVQSAKLIP